ncbi:double-strand break repair helicase AddA [Thioclava sp. SK-1]|uniref:double-strand break repair helicase AddA n=1 Tax=Thioclava sp. SK-1 TaxID=1889770 RepID=UPI00082644F8|nr:double-strand break repair helicase AddA [Thioclava sp. SK-1]OCX61575.1 double-strand break repair helicase AddA [Thioclava sp. SK-1]
MTAPAPTPRDAASEAQIRAASPTRSTWLSANAGSGKTRVLTDRVARLLLAGTEPQKVLCLTYTKAAATEMQNRLLGRLGGWAMLPDAQLRTELSKLGEEGPILPERLAEARRLFAKAIEAPGGLKIQTIHSFCAALLRRFPLEAGVPHGFSEMDERAAQRMRQDILEDIASGEDRAALDHLAMIGALEDLTPLLQAMVHNRTGFGMGLCFDDMLAQFDLPPGYDEATLLADVFDTHDLKMLADLVTVLKTSGPTDQKAAAKLATLSGADLSSLSVLEDVLLTGARTAQPFSGKSGSFPTKDARLACANLMDDLNELIDRVEIARPKRCALQAARRMEALHRFADVFLPRLAAEKAARGWLDFDDLIDRAGRLLSDSALAQWVLFRLDGGIDHILVDEAQDTSPGQWAVIERLADEFTAGEGARDESRTIFIVGDRKQSIYSFQGADLAKFEAMQSHFAQKFDAIDRPLQKAELKHSFRSSHAVLGLTDRTFDRGEAAQGLGGVPEHISFFDAMPGRVDLWPTIEASEKSPAGNWEDPIDLIEETHHTVILAKTIAQEIRAMIDAGVQLPDATGANARPLHEGDFLILVQRRSDLFAEIIRSCKAAGLAIAGADRLKLGAELAVKDIGAVLRFLATPEDDLALAEALKSPFFGWTEQQLYTLAQPRPGYLWEALRNAPEHGPTIRVLQDLLGQADFLRPHDLIERLLTRHQGREKLIARLGIEAEDGIDELISQALAFERSDVPSLTGFLVWLATDDVQVKRQLDSGGRAIRVMTVHGSKGLEAPVVILPDTAKPSQKPHTPKIQRIGDDEIAAWDTVKDERPDILKHAADFTTQRQEEEKMRLLYVAMTRAERWLIVAAAGDVGTGPESWYGLVADGLHAAGAKEDHGQSPELRAQGPIRRLSHGAWPKNGPMAETRVISRAALPDWTQTPAKRPAKPAKPITPSDLGGAKALPGEGLGLDEDAAKRRGRHIHLLLEHLPNWPRDQWDAWASEMLLAGDDAAEPADLPALMAEAVRVLEAPEMQPFLGPETLAEVEVTAPLADFDGAQMHGIIDRLLITDSHVKVLDYKSNAIVPRQAAQIPLGLLRQLAAYRAALKEIHPDKQIDCGILWTATATITWADSAQLDDALRTDPVS